ncbi:MAG TPA: GTP-binding protein, partial [Paracoccaceae bacterium]|nr:GTP-binding protein [Paracoccaceae bacterium]
EVFEDQIACADLILLTKADLAGESGLAVARAAIAAEAPRPLPMIAVTDGAVDPRLILGIGAAAEDDLAARPSHHDGADDHEHEDFDSLVIDLPEIGDPETLQDRIRALARDCRILRAKGFVAVAGKPLRLLVQAVGERVRMQYDRPWGAADRQGRLVVIAEHDDIDEPRIRAILGV